MEAELKAAETALGEAQARCSSYVASWSAYLDCLHATLDTLGLLPAAEPAVYSLGRSFIYICIHSYMVYICSLGRSFPGLISSCLPPAAAGGAMR